MILEDVLSRFGIHENFQYRCLLRNAIKLSDTVIHADLSFQIEAYLIPKYDGTSLHLKNILEVKNDMHEIVVSKLPTYPSYGENITC